MFCRKNRFMMIALVVSFFIGCGSGSDENKTESKPIQKVAKNTRISTYISKGNFVDVASFAYKKATNPSFSKYAMNIMFPGDDKSELVNPSAYNVEIINVDNKLKKIVIENYQNSVEVKIVDKNRVNILFKDSNFTVDKQMSLRDFIAKQ